VQKLSKCGLFTFILFATKIETCLKRISNLIIICRDVQNLSESVFADPRLKFALQVFNALNTNNYVKFFRLVGQEQCLILPLNSQLPEHLYPPFKLFNCQNSVESLFKKFTDKAEFIPRFEMLTIKIVITFAVKTSQKEF